MESSASVKSRFIRLILIVRRAESLQRTRDAAAPLAWMPGDLMDKLGIRAGDNVRLKQGEGEVQLPAARDDKLPANCVRVARASRDGGIG